MRINNSKIYFLLVTLFIGLASTQPSMAQQSSFEDESHKKISCEEALKNVNQIKIGMKESEILDLLGEPTAIKEETWSYNFFPCSSAPKIGEQKIIGVGILFQDKVVEKIGWATICAMGVKPTPKKMKN